MIKKAYILSICIVFLLISCKEENQTNFNYGVSVTAPKEYPVEVNSLGFFAHMGLLLNYIRNNNEKGI